MLRIITGRAKSGKSEICSREFAEHVAAGIDHGAYFIVPEQFTVEAEQRILSLAVMKDKSLFEAEVLSFKRLIHRVLSRLGGGTGNVLSRSGRAMLLISSLSALSGELVWFKDMQQKPAMVLAMLKLIDELETYNSDRSALEQKLSALAETDEKGVSPKYKDLLLIYREFSRRMSEAYSSVGDACDRAIREADEAGFFKGAEIWIDEFTGFTDPELRIIECMLKSGADVTVSLCTSREQEPVFKAVDRTLDRLKELAVAARTGLKVESAEELLSADPRFRRVRVFELLERYYTAYRSVAIPETEYDAAEAQRSVRLIKVRDNYTELKAAAEQIRELHDKDGFPYGSIVVAMRNISDYSAYIGPVFTKAGIPFFVDNMHSVASNPVVLTLLGLLDLLIFDLAREDVAALLKEGLIIDDRASVDVLDNIMIARNMHGPKAFRSAEGDGKDEFRTVYALYSRIETMLGKAATISEAVDGFREVLAELGLEAKANRLADELCGSSVPEKAEELSRIWNIIAELFEQIKALLGDEPAAGHPAGKARLTALQLKAYIETGFAGLEIGFIPQDRDTVRVIGTGRSRPGNPRALLLLGVNEGVMPANINSGGIVRDSERDVMTDAGIGLADDSLLRTYKELFMVYSVLFAPSERLYVSYALKNADGDALEPSSAVVAKIRKILPRIAEEEYACAEPPADENAAGNDIDAGTAGLVIGSAGFYIDKELAEELFRPDGEMMLSISQIESFNKCPLAYFLERKLKIKERDKCELSSAGIGSVVHEVLEKCGEELSNSIDGKAADELEGVARSLVGNHFSAAVQNYYPDLAEMYSAKDQLIIDRLKGFCEDVVLAIARQQHNVSAHPEKVVNFGPIAFEYSFGMDENELPAVEISLPGDGATDDKVKLNGKIDRLDAFGDGTRYYVNVIDYKSSERDYTAADIKKGIWIQLFVYLKAATGTQKARKQVAELIRQKLKAPGGDATVPESSIEPAAGLYMVYDDAIESASDKSEIENGKSVPYAMSGVLINAHTDVAAALNAEGKQDVISVDKKYSWGESEFKEYVGQADDAIRNTALNMLAGRFAAEPESYGGNNKKRSCTFCPFTAVCGIEPAGTETNY